MAPEETMLPKENFPANKCPLCGEENHCGNLAASESCEVCWCAKSDLAFSEKLLSKVPNSAKNKACICKACVLKHNDADL